MPPPSLFIAIPASHLPSPCGCPLATSWCLHHSIWPLINRLIVWCSAYLLETFACNVVLLSSAFGPLVKLQDINWIAVEKEDGTQVHSSMFYMFTLFSSDSWNCSSSYSPEPAFVTGIYSVIVHFSHSLCLEKSVNEWITQAHGLLPSMHFSVHPEISAYILHCEAMYGHGNEIKY